MNKSYDILLIVMIVTGALILFFIGFRVGCLISNITYQQGYSDAYQARIDFEHGK